MEQESNNDHHEDSTPEGSTVNAATNAVLHMTFRNDRPSLEVAIAHARTSEERARLLQVLSTFK